MRWIAISYALVFGLSAHGLADEGAAKVAASTPGAPVAFTHRHGLHLAAEVDRSELPKAWLERLAEHLKSGRTVVLPTPQPAAAVLVVAKDWYSFKWRAQGRHLVLLVHYRGFRLPGLAVDPAPDADAIVIGRSHGVLSASASLPGVALSLDIECLGGAADPGCGGDDLARKVIHHLSVVQ